MTVRGKMPGTMGTPRPPSWTWKPLPQSSELRLGRLSCAHVFQGRMHKAPSALGSTRPQIGTTAAFAFVAGGRRDGCRRSVACLSFIGAKGQCPFGAWPLANRTAQSLVASWCSLLLAPYDWGSKRQTGSTTVGTTGCRSPFTLLPR